MKRKMISQTIVILAVLLTFGCTQNKQEKGAEIAKIEVNKLLANAKSYEPVETEVDSAFTSVYTDEEIVTAAYELVDLYEKYEEVQEKYNDAKSNAALWEGSYMSAYAKEEHKQAKEKMNKYASQLSEIEDDIISQNKIIRERAEGIEENRFYGWNIYHRFRYANGLRLCDLLIIVDENMENVISRFVLKDYCPLPFSTETDHTFDKLKQIIDKAINMNEQ
jgi:protein subunit release factor A